MLYQIVFALFFCTCTPSIYAMDFDMDPKPVPVHDQAFMMSLQHAEEKSELSQGRRNFLFSSGVMTSFLLNTALYYALTGKKSFATQMITILNWISGVYISGQLLFRFLSKAYKLGLATGQLVQLTASKNPFLDLRKHNPILFQDERLQKLQEQFFENISNINELKRDDNARAFLYDTIGQTSERAVQYRKRSSFLSGFLITHLFTGHLPFWWL